MRMRDIMRIAAAAAVLTGGVSLAGCNDNAHPKGWSNQWYRKGHTPADVAKWEREHPNRARHDSDSGDSGDDGGAVDQTGGYPGPGGH